MTIPRQQVLLRLAQGTEVGIWEIDKAGLTRDLNPAMCALLEVNSAAELEGLSFHGFFTAESLETMEREHAKRQTGMRSTYEVELCGRRGTRRIVMISGVPLVDEQGQLDGLIGTFVDVTTRALMARELATSEARYRTFMTEASDAILVGKPDASGYLDANPSACRLLGYSVEELFDMPPQRLVAPAHLERLPIAFDEMARGNSILRRRELRTKDGRTIHVESNSKQLPDGTYLSIVRDITAQVQMEQERSELEERLRQKQRIESLGQLASGVAHDFNNLLLVIMHGLEDSGDAESVALAKLAAERAAGLTRQLLSFSRQEPQRLAPLELNELVDSTHGLLRSLGGAALEIAVELERSAPLELLGDSAQLSQIIINLVLNARDAMNGKGKVTIHSGRLDLAAPRVVNSGALGEGSWVWLAVDDTGHGMSEAIVEHIFEPFFTTKPVGQGTGLGLASAYGVVLQHRGAIEVESREGTGSTFTIYLPALSPGHAGDVPAPPPYSPNQRRDPRVVVVDDEPAVRRMMVNALRRAGYQVREAESADAALRLLEFAPGLDALVSDVRMPGMNGPELHAQIERLHGPVPVLFVTGHPETQLEEHPGTRVLLKPFRATALVEALAPLVGASG